MNAYQIAALLIGGGVLFGLAVTAAAVWVESLDDADRADFEASVMGDIRSLPGGVL